MWRWLTAGQLRIYDNTMHLYAQTDNDAGATNVVQRTDGTVILLGSGGRNATSRDRNKLPVAVRPHTAYTQVQK